MLADSGHFGEHSAAESPLGSESQRDRMAELTDGLDSTVAARALLQILRAKRNPYSEKLYAEIGAAIDALGSPNTVLAELGRGHLGMIDLFTPQLIERAIIAALEEVRHWREGGKSIIARGSMAYPVQLADVADAPPMLFVEGDCRVLNRAGIAIVGARAASPEGKKRSEKAARILAEAGLVVFSGMAKGIDTAAHRGALAQKGLTVAVMGTPIDRRYPRENTGLADEILAAGGALVSEFMPGDKTASWHFLRRNRTMSGLSLATLVIEASETSGSRSQAKAALEQGRPVFLPVSLISSHAWARNMVEQGIGGRHALAVRHPEDVALALAGGLNEPAVTF